MDYDEQAALKLEADQDRRFRAAPDKIKFFEDKHEKSVSIRIKHHRAMSDTYSPTDR